MMWVTLCDSYLSLTADNLGQGLGHILFFLHLLPQHLTVAHGRATTCTWRLELTDVHALTVGHKRVELLLQSMRHAIKQKLRRVSLCPIQRYVTC
jgi:hypothetical protein